MNIHRSHTYSSDCLYYVEHPHDYSSEEPTGYAKALGFIMVTQQSRFSHRPAHSAISVTHLEPISAKQNICAKQYKADYQAQCIYFV